MAAALGFQLGPWYIDELLQEARDGHLKVSLSSNECGVLRYLFDRRDQGPVPPEALLTEVLGYADSVESRALDASLLRLRRKLAEHPTQPQVVARRRGVGVYLVGAAPASPPARVRVPVPPGRDGLVIDVLAALDLPGVITLLGPSGVGKTAIGRHLVERNLGIFVDLLTVETTEALVSLVASVLGCRPEVIAERLVGLDKTLVLDNFEQLEPAAALEVERWGATVAVLVTSVRPLRIPNERVIAVPPLDRATAEAVLREQAARAGVDAPAAAFRTVLDAVGGLPLALQLLAPVLASVPTLAPADLLELSSDRPGDPDRHRSLRAAMDRARNYSSPEAVDLLGTLAVFQGAFRLDAVAAVAGLALPVALGLTRELCRNGLLELRGDRYRLPPTVRLYAQGLPADPQVKPRLLAFLASLRIAMVTHGPDPVALYRGDLLGMALSPVSDEAFVELVLIQEFGALDPRLLREAERRLAASEPASAELLAVVSFVRRLLGNLGPPLAGVHDRLASLPRHTPFSLSELRSTVRGALAYEDLVAVLPDASTPKELILLGTLSTRCPDDRAELLLGAAVERCEADGWDYLGDFLRGALAERWFRDGQVLRALGLLRDIPFARLLQHARLTHVLCAWHLGDWDEARNLADRAVDLELRATAVLPHQLAAFRAVRAAIAWLNGETRASERALEAVNTPHAGDGLGMLPVALLVLRLEGRTTASTGSPAVDALLVGGQPGHNGGLMWTLIDWMVQRARERGLVPAPS